MFFKTQQLASCTGDLAATSVMVSGGTFHTRLTNIRYALIWGSKQEVDFHMARSMHGLDNRHVVKVGEICQRSVWPSWWGGGVQYLRSLITYVNCHIEFALPLPVSRVSLGTIKTIVTKVQMFDSVHQRLRESPSLILPATRFRHSGGLQ